MDSWCPQFTWEIVGHSFNGPVWILPLQQWDVILGINWLKQFGSIHIDFNISTISFQHQGSWVQLQGIKVHPPHSTSPQTTSCNYLSTAQPAWMTQLIESYEDDPEITHVISELAISQMGQLNFL